MFYLPHQDTDNLDRPTFYSDSALQTQYYGLNFTDSLTHFDFKNYTHTRYISTPSRIMFLSKTTGRYTYTHHVLDPEEGHF